MLAEFRADYGRMLNDLALSALIEELKTESKLFAQEWEAKSVLEREGGVRTFRHPREGFLTCTQHTLSPAQRADYKLVTLFPTNLQ